MAKYMQIANGQIAYDEQGVGPTVICIPSMGDLRSEYRYLTPQLVSAGYHVVTMDVRGHGNSSVRWPDYSFAGVGADICSLIDALFAAGHPTLATLFAAAILLDYAIMIERIRWLLGLG